MEPLSKVLIILMLQSRGCLVDHDDKFKDRCELPAALDKPEVCFEHKIRKNFTMSYINFSPHSQLILAFYGRYQGLFPIDLL
jgi:hypothetical protein